MKVFFCDCGKVKSHSLRNCCDECAVIKKEARKEKAKLDARERRRLHGSKVNRSPLCSTCKKEKEHVDRGYCNECERKRYYLKDKPDCATCGAIKENPRDAYCKMCKRNRAHEKSLDEGRREKNSHGEGRKITCADCGLIKEEAYLNESYCGKCKYERKKILRPYRNSDQKFKDAVRQLTYNKIRQGVLIKKPCEVCGTERDVQAHHDDYYKPLDVRWLCRTHHQEHHRNDNNKD